MFDCLECEKAIVVKGKCKMDKREKVFLGEVISDKMDKTVVIKVSRTFRHSTLGKVVVRSKKYKVHDQNDEAKIGDWIEAVECRPISKTKYMILKQIVRKTV